MKNTHLFAVQENYQGMLKLISLLYRIIKRRDSTFSSLKDAVKFSVDWLDSKLLQRVLKSGRKGISHRRTDEMIDAIYSSVIPGIYSEMIGGLEIGEDIVFGSLMDLRSKVKKCKEYAGIGVKYPVIRDASLITRVIAF